MVTPLPPSRPADLPAPHKDPVSFSAFAPPSVQVPLFVSVCICVSFPCLFVCVRVLTCVFCVQPMSVFPLYVWAYLPEDKKEVIRRAQMTAAKKEVGSKGSVQIARGELVCVFLFCVCFVMLSSHFRVFRCPFSFVSI